VHQVGHYPELHQDAARSTKHKKYKKYFTYIYIFIYLLVALQHSAGRPDFKEILLNQEHRGVLLLYCRRLQHRGVLLLYCRRLQSRTLESVE
jgi:hypothetical protein